MTQGNLYKELPDDFLFNMWDGCAHLDCLPKCRTMQGHCERMEIALNEWRARRNLTHSSHTQNTQGE